MPTYIATGRALTLSLTGPALTVTTKALTTNVATLTTSVAHNMVVGQKVVVAISDAVFDGTQTITAVTSTTFSYAKTNANVTSTGATGTASPVFDISPQSQSAVLKYENKVDTFQTLTGMTKKVTSTDGSIDVSMFQDWGAAQSFAKALWDMAASGTAVPFTFLADGSTFSGNVIPQFPNVGGAGDAALDTGVTLEITGTVARS